jgi:hypothetical protein
VFGNRLLVKIVKCKSEEVTRGWKKFHNEVKERDHFGRCRHKYVDNIKWYFILKTPCILSQSLFKNTNWMHFYLKKLYSSLKHYNKTGHIFRLLTEPSSGVFFVTKTVCVCTDRLSDTHTTRYSTHHKNTTPRTR